MVTRNTTIFSKPYHWKSKARSPGVITSREVTYLNRTFFRSYYEVLVLIVPEDSLNRSSCSTREVAGSVTTLRPGNYLELCSSASSLPRCGSYLHSYLIMIFFFLYMRTARKPFLPLGFLLHSNKLESWWDQEPHPFFEAEVGKRNHRWAIQLFPQHAVCSASLVYFWMIGMPTGTVVECRILNFWLAPRYFVGIFRRRNVVETSNYMQRNPAWKRFWASRLRLLGGDRVISAIWMLGTRAIEQPISTTHLVEILSKSPLVEKIISFIKTTILVGLRNKNST